MLPVVKPPTASVLQTCCLLKNLKFNPWAPCIVTRESESSLVQTSANGFTRCLVYPIFASRDHYFLCGAPKCTKKKNSRLAVLAGLLAVLEYFLPQQVDELLAVQGKFRNSIPGLPGCYHLEKRHKRMRGPKIYR